MTLVALSLAAVLYANAAITPTPAFSAEAHPPAVPAAQPLGAYASVGDVAAVVCAPEFSWDCGWALDTTWCESRWVLEAYNPAGPYVGWWQVLNGPFDPYLNTVEAHIKYSAWQRGEVACPWPVCGR